MITSSVLSYVAKICAEYGIAIESASNDIITFRAKDGAFISRAETNGEALCFITGLGHGSITGAEKVLSVLHETLQETREPQTKKKT